ncbi:MAG: hypothetical protein MK101_04585 [Phycisphaerales bacterium]|nr:hypothetical protein [Phycisphaerales bacterium]
MRRGSRSAPVSLFSFQDVMVSTIGVTLLIILVLLLITGREAAALLPVVTQDPLPAETDPALPQIEETEDVTALALELLAMEDRIELLQIELMDALEGAQRARTDAQLDGEAALRAARSRRATALKAELESIRSKRRVTYLLDKADADLVPLIIELGGARAVLGTGADEDAPIAFTASDPATLATFVLDWIDKHPERDRLKLVFVVRPSGLAAWNNVQRSLPRFTDDGIGFGLDLIAESWSTSGLLPGTPEASP